MKKIVFAAVLCFASSSFAAAPDTVASVDLNRYMGTWYEIASMPNYFQRKCVSDTKAEYERAPETSLIRVVNSCKTKTGEVMAAEGRARVTEKSNGAKLKVTFVKLFDWVFAAGGQYWVLDLAQDYSYAVVGHPTRRFGWVLARTPFLPTETLMTIEKGLKAQGFDTCKFKTTVQTGGLNESKALCQITQGDGSEVVPHSEDEASLDEFELASFN